MTTLTKACLKHLTLAAILTLAATGCTTTSSTTSSQSQNTGSSVTIFGDIDAGVSRVR